MTDDRVFIGLGGNLASVRHGPPPAVLSAALMRLTTLGVPMFRRSRWYVSTPVPPSPQPDFVNAVAEVGATQPPRVLLALLHQVEAEFGRTRSVANAARVLDLDLLAYGETIIEEPHGLWLPHPRLHQRAFVLKPLAELAPDWRHPRLALTLTELLATLPEEQRAEPWE